MFRDLQGTREIEAMATAVPTDGGEMAEMPRLPKFNLYSKLRRERRVTVAVTVRNFPRKMARRTDQSSPMYTQVLH